MGGMSWIHWVIVAAVVMLLFGGRGKISELMGDFAKGIKAFKKGMSDDEKAEVETKPDVAKSIDHQAVSGMKARAETEKKLEGGTV
jgi:sec-independent protein translocase protein TatA